MSEQSMSYLSPTTQKIVDDAKHQLASLTHHSQAIAYLRLIEAFTEMATALVLDAPPTNEDSGT